MYTFLYVPVWQEINKNGTSPMHTQNLLYTLCTSHTENELFVHKYLHTVWAQRIFWISGLEKTKNRHRLEIELQIITNGNNNNGFTSSQLVIKKNEVKHWHVPLNSFLSSGIKQCIYFIPGKQTSQFSSVHFFKFHKTYKITLIQ